MAAGLNCWPFPIVSGLLYHVSGKMPDVKKQTRRKALRLSAA
jgi:hypothetical protein